MIAGRVAAVRGVFGPAVFLVATDSRSNSQRPQLIVARVAFATLVASATLVAFATLGLHPAALGLP